MKGRVLAAALAIVAAGVATDALAQPPADAQALKAAGDGLFDQARYAEAYEQYVRAYAAHRDPALLYNQARALEAMGEYPEALDKLDEFSRTAQPDVRARVPKLGELTDDLRRRIATVHVTTNAPDARLYMRGKDLGVVGRERNVRVRAGQTTVRVAAEGHRPFERALNLAGGTTTQLDAKLDAIEPEPKRGGITSKWWFWTAVGVVVVGGVATAIVLTREDDPQTGTFSPPQVRVQGVRF